jgi:hypothetical protein
MLYNFQNFALLQKTFVNILYDFNPWAYARAFSQITLNIFKLKIAIFFSIYTTNDGNSLHHTPAMPFPP